MRCIGCGHPALARWPTAGRIREGGGQEDHLPAVPRSAHGRVIVAYLLGLYLGDGHIVHGPRDVYVLAIACSDDWPGLMAAARQAMAAVMPASSVCGVKQTGCTMIKSYSKHWPCLFPQHGPGRKHQRKIELAHWQEVIVRKYPGEFARGLFHSDGWRGVNRVCRTLADGDHWYEYPRYLFGNESADILRLCGEALDQLGVAWRYSRRNSISVARRGAGRWRGSTSSSALSTDGVANAEPTAAQLTGLGCSRLDRLGWRLAG